MIRFRGIGGWATMAGRAFPGPLEPKALRFLFLSLSPFRDGATVREGGRGKSFGDASAILDAPRKPRKGRAIVLCEVPV